MWYLLRSRHALKHYFLDATDRNNFRFCLSLRWLKICLWFVPGWVCAGGAEVPLPLVTDWWVDMEYIPLQNPPIGPTSSNCWKVNVPLSSNTPHSRSCQHTWRIFVKINWGRCVLSYYAVILTLPRCWLSFGDRCNSIFVQFCLACSSFIYIYYCIKQITNSMGYTANLVR